MYSSEKNPGINWKDIIVKGIIFILFVLLIIWIFPKTPNMKTFYSSVFRENISYMKDAAKSYYTTDKLPITIGESSKMTLQDMIDKKIILPFVDKDGKSCDTEASYVQITREDGEYVLKVNLVCGDENDYIVEPLGCYGYCDTDTCGTKKTALEYQFKQAYSDKETNYSCPTGYTLSGTKCAKNSSKIIDAIANYSKDTVKITDSLEKTVGSGYTYSDPISTTKNNYTCPSGYTLSGTKCNKTTTSTINATVTGMATTYTCPSGYTLSGTKCNKTTTDTVNVTTTSKRTYLAGTYTVAPAGYTCSTATEYVCTSITNCPGYVTIYSACYKYDVSYTCPSGYTKNGTTCTKTTTSTIDATKTGSTTLSCQDGYSLSGTTCRKYVEGTLYKYCSSANAVLSGSKCYETIKGSFIGYTCPTAKYTLTNGKCVLITEDLIDATASVKTVVKYSYKWSKETTLSGWERTGVTRTVEV